MEKVVDKLIKDFTIGELSFKLGITRAIAYKGMKKYPEYFNSILKNETTQKLLKTTGFDELKNLKNADDIVKLLGKHPDIFDNLDNFRELKTEQDKMAVNIVNYLLPEMLEYAESDLCDCEDYEALAKHIIDFCDENDILFDYADYETGELVQGFYGNVMDLIALGFTQDSVRKTSKMRIIVK